jgi:hypothetical protein
VARLHLKVPPMTARVCDHDTGSQGAFLLSVGGVTLKQVTRRNTEHLYSRLPTLVIRVLCYCTMLQCAA